MALEAALTGVPIVMPVNVGGFACAVVSIPCKYGTSESVCTTPARRGREPDGAVAAGICAPLFTAPDLPDALTGFLFAGTKLSDSVFCFLVATDLSDSVGALFSGIELSDPVSSRLSTYAPCGQADVVM